MDWKKWTVIFHQTSLTYPACSKSPPKVSLKKLVTTGGSNSLLSWKGKERVSFQGNLEENLSAWAPEYPHTEPGVFRALTFLRIESLKKASIWSYASLMRRESTPWLITWKHPWLEHALRTSLTARLVASSSSPLRNPPRSTIGAWNSSFASTKHSLGQTKLMGTWGCICSQEGSKKRLWTTSWWFGDDTKQKPESMMSRWCEMKI